MSDYICDVSDLTDGVPFETRVNDRGVVVVRVDGEVYAFDGVCPHWGGPLAKGEVSVKRHEITCPWHRFRYSLRDGSCVASTGRPGVDVFTVRVEDGKIFADIPKAARKATA